MRSPRLPRSTGFALIALAFAGAGCSSRAASPAPDAGTQTGALNPDGVPYPTQNLGYTPRRCTVADCSSGTPGSVLHDFGFQGYLNQDPSMVDETTAGLQTISMAQYFDPQNRRYKVLHVTVASVWCVPCSQETDALVGPLTVALAQKGVVLLQALDDGATPGTAATSSDLTSWVQTKKPNFTDVLDTNGNLGAFIPGFAVPWNAYVDPRTMELLDAQVGYSGDPAGDAQKWIDWVANNPPSYP